MGKLIQAHLPCPHCSSSDAYSEYEENFHCFSCGKSVKKTGERMYKLPVQETATWDGELPDDFTTDIPTLGLAWLYKFGINDALIAQYNIGWGHGRVILPIYEKGHLVAYQGRDVTNEGPKYITKSTGPFYFKTFITRPRILVLVEDILSAIKIGQVMPCLALCGTKLRQGAESLDLLTDYCEDFILWLDGDQPGIDASHEIRKSLSLVGTCSVILTTRDPKAHSLDEITQTLGVKSGYYRPNTTKIIIE